MSGIKWRPLLCSVWKLNNYSIMKMQFEIWHIMLGFPKLGHIYQRLAIIKFPSP